MTWTWMNIALVALAFPVGVLIVYRLQRLGGGRSPIAAGGKPPVARPASQLPVRSLDELLTATRSIELLRSIEQRTRFSSAMFERDCQPIFALVAEFVQMLPASECHHHAQPGGLWIHMLEVVDAALTYRAGMEIPFGASTEERKRLEHRWTFGVLLAALLHDIGKPVTDVVVTIYAQDPRHGRPWSALAGPMRPQGAQAYTRYRLAVRLLARHITGNPNCPLSAVMLDEIDVEVMLSWRAERATKVKGTTLNTDRRHLSSLFNYAVQLRWLDVNPTSWIRPAPDAEAAERSVPRHTLVSYIDMLKTDFWYDSKGKRHDSFHPQFFWQVALEALYYTGMRRRQLVGLQWRDVDFDEKVIVLRAQTSKTRRSWNVPLPARLETGMRELLRQTMFITNRSKHQLGDDQVFCLPLFSCRPFKDKNMSVGNVSSFFQRLSVRTASKCADMPRISSHRIRHTTATVLANSVPNIKTVQQLLGHTSLSTTMVYVHPDVEDMRNAVEKL